MQSSPVLSQRIHKVEELSQNCQIMPDLQGAGVGASAQNGCKESLGTRENLLHFLHET